MTGDVWIVDKNDVVILAILRNYMPRPLLSLMSDVLHDDWAKQREERSKTEVVKESKATRHSGFQAESRHYSAHGLRQGSEYYLYEEVDPNLLVRSLPMFEWSDIVLHKYLSQYVSIVNSKRHNKLRVGQYLVSGLVFNYTDCDIHHDLKDLCPAILSYVNPPPYKCHIHVNGIPEQNWFGGEFLIRCMGIKICVNPGDVILFESRIFHEVEKPVPVPVWNSFLL